MIANNNNKELIINRQIFLIIKNSGNFKIPGAILLPQFSYIEQHVGLDCGIE